MRVHLLIVMIALLGILATQSTAMGQGTRSSFGSSSQLGGGGFSAGSRTLGGGTGGLNIAGGGDPFSGMTGAGGEITGSERFLRGNQQSAGFIGGGAENAAAFIGAMSEAAGMGGRAGQRRTGLGARGGNRAGGANQGGGRGRRGSTEIRASLRVAFNVPAKPPTRVSTALAQRLARTSRIRTVSAVDVLILDGTATLRGVVATDHDRDLVEQFARLEAGIWKVKNELVVAAKPAEPEPVPPGAPEDAQPPRPDTPAEPAAR